jgi:hypothetical protein
MSEEIVGFEPILSKLVEIGVERQEAERIARFVAAGDGYEFESEHVHYEAACHSGCCGQDMFIRGHHGEVQLFHNSVRDY